MEDGFEDKKSLVRNLILGIELTHEEELRFKNYFRNDIEFYKFIIVSGLIEEFGIEYFDELGINVNFLAIIESGNFEKYLDDSKLLEKLGIQTNEIIDLIINEGLSEKFLKHPKTLINLQIGGSGIIRLIMAAGLSKKYLENPELLEKWNFHNYEIVDLIIAAKLSKEYLEKQEFLEKWGFSSYEIVDLIMDANLSKEYLEKQEFLEKWNFHGENIVNLIINAKLSKKYLESPEKIKALKISETGIVDLIKDAKLSKEYVENPERLEKLGVNKCFLADLIIEAKLSKEYLKKPELLKSLNLSSSLIFELIKDAGLLEEYLENPDRLKSLGIEEFDIYYDSDALNFLAIKTLNNHILEREAKYSSIGLDSAITIGIEIESEESLCDMTEIIKKNEKLLERWKIKFDGSLDFGCEIVSPILKDVEKDVEEIYLICEYLQYLCQEATRKCGGHVHIGADYLKSPEAYINLLEIWKNCEDIFYIISNEPGELTRGVVSRDDEPYYAKKMSSKIDEILDDISNDGLIEADKLEESVQKIKEMQKKIENKQGGRYYGINFQSIIRHNTIEFRLSNGTINPDTWVENIKLFGRIIEVSEKLAEIELKQKNGIELTNEEKKMLQLKQELKREDLDEPEKCKKLLELLFKEGEREVYQERYDVNSKLLKDESIIKQFNIETEGKSDNVSKSNKIKETLSRIEKRNGESISSLLQKNETYNKALLKKISDALLSKENQEQLFQTKSVDDSEKSLTKV